MCLISRLLEVLGQESEGAVEAVWLEPHDGPPLHAQPPGVEAGHQGGAAGGTLGRHVGLAQPHSRAGQALGQVVIIYMAVHSELPSTFLFSYS